MMNWISVNDRLPENDDMVLVWFCKANHLPDLSFGGIEMAYYISGRWEERGSPCGSDMEVNQDMLMVTHWMPFPEQPKN